MAKFIKYTHPHISVVGQPQMRIVEEVLISVDDIRSLCHNKDGFFVSTKLIDKVYCGVKEIAADNLILKVSEEDYELTKQVLASCEPVDCQIRFKEFPFPEDVFQDANDEEKERERIKKALDEHNGCIPCTAKALGMTERTLVRKKKEYGL